MDWLSKHTRHHESISILVVEVGKEVSIEFLVDFPLLISEVLVVLHAVLEISCSVGVSVRLELSPWNMLNERGREVKRLFDWLGDCFSLRFVWSPNSWVDISCSTDLSQVVATISTSIIMDVVVVEDSDWYSCVVVRQGNEAHFNVQYTS